MSSVDAGTVRDSVAYDGLTDSERESERTEKHARDVESVRTFLRSAANGTAGADVELGMPENEASQQKALLRANTLYADYMAYVLSHPDTLDFTTYCESVGGRAFLRMMTRMKGRKEIIREFIGGSGNLPRLSDVQEFIILDKQREKDPAKFVAALFTDVPGSRAVVHKLLNRYADMVREEWRTMRVKPESPLPGENDWLFADALDGDALELAVEAYKGGTGLNKAASMFKVSNRRLRDTLAERELLRLPKKGAK